MKSPYEPFSVDVVAPQGIPKTIKYRGRVLQVKEILNKWRIDDDWWVKPISRMYYQLEFTSGARYTIFQDLITLQWYKQNWIEPEKQ